MLAIISSIQNVETRLTEKEDWFHVFAAVSECRICTSSCDHASTTCWSYSSYQKLRTWNTTFQESPYLTECRQGKCQLTVVVSIARQILQIWPVSTTTLGECKWSECHKTSTKALHWRGRRWGQCTKHRSTLMDPSWSQCCCLFLGVLWTVVRMK